MILQLCWSADNSVGDELSGGAEDNDTSEKEAESTATSTSAALGATHHQRDHPALPPGQPIALRKAGDCGFRVEERR